MQEYSRLYLQNVSKIWTITVFELKPHNNRMERQIKKSRRRYGIMLRNLTLHADLIFNLSSLETHYSIGLSFGYFKLFTWTNVIALLVVVTFARHLFIVLLYCWRFFMFPFDYLKVIGHLFLSCHYPWHLHLLFSLLLFHSTSPEWYCRVQLFYEVF